MSGDSISEQSGRVAVGELDQIWTPRSPRPGRRGVVLVHGSGNPAGFIDGLTQPSSVKLAAALASAGIPCIAGDFGLQAWGNDTVVSRIDSAWAVLKAQFPAMRTDKVILIGASMGGAAVAHYSQSNPTQVAAVVGIIPLWDLKSFYAYPAYAGSVQNEIAAAWGVPAGTPLPARADTLANARAAAGIPHMCAYSTADTTVLPPWSTNYADAVGAWKIVTDTQYGHSDQAVGGLSLSTLGAYLKAHGA